MKTIVGETIKCLQSYWALVNTRAAQEAGFISRAAYSHTRLFRVNPLADLDKGSSIKIKKKNSPLSWIRFLNPFTLVNYFAKFCLTSIAGAFRLIEAPKKTTKLVAVGKSPTGRVIKEPRQVYRKSSWLISGLKALALLPFAILDAITTPFALAGDLPMTSMKIKTPTALHSLNRFFYGKFEPVRIKKPSVIAPKQHSIFAHSDEVKPLTLTKEETNKEEPDMPKLHG